MGEKKRGVWKKLLGHLQKFAPAIVAGVTGGPVAGLVTAAKALTGAPGNADMDEVAAAIMGSPELMLKMEELAVEKERIWHETERARLDHQAAEVRENTARIEAVNATMRAEAAGEDPWTRRWRPYTGFVTATVWGILGLSFAVAAVLVACGVAEVAVLTAIGTAFAGMTVFWGVPLAILGVASWKRGSMQIERAKARVATLVGRPQVEPVT